LAHRHYRLARRTLRSDSGRRSRAMGCAGLFGVVVVDVVVVFEYVVDFDDVVVIDVG
jgi:hypothetical protein